MLTMTKGEVAALEKYLLWMHGFEESVLYQDYREAEGFTDHEYAEARDILSDLIERHRDSQGKECPPCL